MNFSLIKKVTKYVLFLGVIFGGLAVAFIQAGGNVNNLINIEGVIDVSDGNIRLDLSWPYTCDPDIWFCEEEKLKLCKSDFPRENYIAVARTDYNPGTDYQWKTEQTFCVEPQCVDLGTSPGTGMNLTDDNEVNFSEYPARDVCKSIGGRLPTRGELQCIYVKRSGLGSFFSGEYWSATESSETSASRHHFSIGLSYNRSKIDNGGRVRCVLGY